MRTLLAILFLGLSASAQNPTQHLQSLSASERAFAAATRHLGVRNGFLTFFADDAVGFRPIYGPYKGTLKGRPQPLPTLLLWTPMEGDVSRDGELGWLTGPSVARENKPGGRDVYFGQYFSVWKKQLDGTWKVLLDAGIEVPKLTGDPETGLFQPHALFSEAPDTTVRGTAAELAAAEQSLNDALKRSGPAAAEHYASTARFHIDSLQPITALHATQGFIRSLPATKHQSYASSCSSSGDLGYSYGEYLQNGTTMYYIRTWKYLKGSLWLVTVEWRG